MAMIQFRVDDDLKLQAMAVFEKLGIDLSTAVRMFLKRSVLVGGIPFSMVIDEEPYDAEKALRAMRTLQEISQKNGNSEMTLDEINDEIRLARLERKQRK